MVQGCQQDSRWNSMVNWLLRRRYPRQPQIRGTFLESRGHLDIECEFRSEMGAPRVKERWTGKTWYYFGQNLSPFRRRSADGCGQFPRIRADRAKGVVTQEAAQPLEDT